MLAIHFYDLFSDNGCTNVWVQFPSYAIPIHHLDAHIDVDIKRSLLFIHNLSGSDVTSFLFGKGKKSFMRALKAHQGELASQCVALNQNLQESPSQLSKDVSTALHTTASNVALSLYSKAKMKKCTDLDTLRAQLFQTSRDLTALPPTKDAFYHHFLRALLQTIIWMQANKAKPVIPNVSEFGWHSVNGIIQPLLTRLPPLPEVYVSD